MRNSAFAMATGLAILTAGALAPGAVDAVTLPAPAGLSAATAATSAVEQVRLHCHSWLDGRRWHKRCWNAPDWWNPGWGWAPGQVTTLNPQPLPPKAFGPGPGPGPWAGPGGPGAAGAGGKTAGAKAAKATAAKKGAGPGAGGATKY